MMLQLPLNLSYIDTNLQQFIAIWAASNEVLHFV